MRHVHRHKMQHDNDEDSDFTIQPRNKEVTKNLLLSNNKLDPKLSNLEHHIFVMSIFIVKQYKKIYSQE
jgi:hypothetical protein